MTKLENLLKRHLELDVRMKFTDTELKLAIIFWSGETYMWDLLNGYCQLSEEEVENLCNDDSFDVCFDLGRKPAFIDLYEVFNDFAGCPKIHKNLYYYYQGDLYDKHGNRTDRHSQFFYSKDEAVKAWQEEIKKKVEKLQGQINSLLTTEVTIEEVD